MTRLNFFLKTGAFLLFAWGAILAPGESLNALDIRPSALSFYGLPRKKFKRTVQIKNDGADRLQVVVSFEPQKQSEVKPWIEVKDSQFDLEPGETRDRKSTRLNSS